VLSDTRREARQENEIYEPAGRKTIAIRTWFGRVHVRGQAGNEHQAPFAPRRMVVPFGQRRRSAPYFTMFTNGDRPWMRTSSRSADSIGPTPLGVPVRMISPGSKVMFVEMKLTR
jgi:hypothetical protein